MRHPPNHIFEFTPQSLETWFVERRLPKYRAAQVLEWVYAKGVSDPAKMSNLSKLDREMLIKEMVFESGTVVREARATDGVRKLLIEWNSEHARDRQDAGSEAASARVPLLPIVSNGDSSRQTECVMIPSDARRTACISSQVGCPVGCRFCASGLGGLDGNLSAGRIVEQVWRLQRLMRDEEATAGTDTGTGSKGEESRNGEQGGSVRRTDRPGGGEREAKPPRITNVVFMGMGEPLANIANVTRAIRTLNAPWGMNISARKITISTVGLPQAIERLAEEFELPVTLALSLHAPNDAIRRELIPWASYTTIKDLLAACQKWFAKTGREITLEYTLLRGVNDRPEHAAELASIAKSLRANINLIRYNEVAGLPFNRPRTDDVLEFQRLLKARGINVHIRASRGRDIAAACGQLRHEHTAKAAG